MKKKKDKKDVQSPETLGSLVSLIFKGMLTNLKKSFFRILLFTIAVWALHTYLLVVVNEGFASAGTFVSNILALEGNEIAGTLFWMVLSFIAVSVLIQVRQDGVSGFSARFGQISSWVSSSKKAIGAEYLPLVAAGAAPALLIGWFIGNYALSILLAVLLIFALAAREQSLLILSYRLSYSDVKRRFFGATEFSPLEIGKTALCFVGGIVGFILVALVPSAALILAVLGILYAAWWYRSKGRHGGSPPKTAVTYGIAIFILISSFIIIPVAAHDGGWQESGGTFDQWVTSQGAGIAVATGVPAACGAAAGALVAGGASTGSIAGIVPDPKTLARMQQEEWARVAAQQNLLEGRLTTVINVLKGTVLIADVSIDFLSNFTGGFGKAIKYTYSGVKTFTVTLAEGKGVGTAALRTGGTLAIDGALDLVTGGVGPDLGIVPGDSIIRNGARAVGNTAISQGTGRTVGQTAYNDLFSPRAPPPTSYIPGPAKGPGMLK